jgi:hypothetical protein
MILRGLSEMWKLYVNNIMFACSLPMSTSTWRPDHCNGPSGYMSGELKSENINKKKAHTRQSYYPAKITQLPHRIQVHSRKILVKEIQFLYELQRPSRLKTLMNCSSLLNAITNDLDRSLRQAGEFKIITFLLTPVKRESPEK